CIATAIALVVPAYSFAGDCGSTSYDCAIYYIEHHHASEAVDVLNRELAQSPQNLKELNLLGIALTEAGQAESTAAQFKQALAIDPALYPARINLAWNHFNSRRRDDAAQNFARFLEHVPTDDIANTYLGEISFQKQDCASAIGYYQKAAERVTSRPVWTLHF